MGREAGRDVNDDGGEEGEGGETREKGKGGSRTSGFSSVAATADRGRGKGEQTSRSRPPT